MNWPAFQQNVVALLPQIAQALLILAVGFAVAWLAAVLARAFVRRTSLHRRLAETPDLRGALDPESVAKWVGGLVFAFVALYALIYFFSALDIPTVAVPLGGMAATITAYLPKILSALLLLALGWALATVVRTVVTRGVRGAGFDRPVTNAPDRHATLSGILGDAAYWLTFFFFLPAVLDALSLTGILDPVQVMMREMLAMVPNLLAAGVLLAAGLFIARVVQRLTTSMLAAAGADRMTRALGLGSLGEMTLSGLAGTVAYALVLLPVAVAALDALRLEAVTRPVSGMLNQILSAVPNILAALFILLLAYVVGRVVASLTARVLRSAGFDGLLGRMQVTRTLPAGTTPSDIAGQLALWTVLLLAGIEAAAQLGFTELSLLLSAFLVFAGRVLLGLVVFVLGSLLAGVVADAVRGSTVPNGAALAPVARVAVLALASVMALSQMGIAQEIVVLAFAMTLGSAAVAAALAFGVGGRDAARELLRRWVRTGPPPSNGGGTSHGPII